MFYLHFSLHCDKGHASLCLLLYCNAPLLPTFFPTFLSTLLPCAVQQLSFTSIPLTFVPCVAGRGSDSLKKRSNSTVSERIFLAQKYYKIFDFFSGANGSLDVLDGVLTLLTLALSRERDAVVDEDEDDREEEGEGEGRKQEKQDDSGSFTALTTADVAAVMAVVRGQQCRLILHER